MAPKKEAKAPPKKSAAKPKAKAKGAKGDEKKPVKKAVFKRYNKIRTTVQFHRPYTRRTKGQKKYVRRSGRSVSIAQKKDQVLISTAKKIGKHRFLSSSTS